MRLQADTGLWRTGTPAEPPPLTAVLEVSGAVLEWTIDNATAASITFTDPDHADWLWRVLGEAGHVDILAAIEGSARQPLELGGVDFDTTTLAPLRRLATGHWLQRWWPTSPRDGIVGLDPALLAAELAVLTAAAEPFFTEETLDSGVEDLLRPHVGVLAGLQASADRRIRELADAAIELAELHGIAAATLITAGLGRRDDYALAAGDGRRRDGLAIARGVDSVQWSAVPAAVFDAAEHTIDWRIDTAGAEVVAAVEVAVLTIGRSGGVPVRLDANGATASGALDDRGQARITVVDADGHPLTEVAAWNVNWAGSTVRIGAPATDPASARARVRALARQRMAAPGDDAFLAEVMAMESLY